MSVKVADVFVVVCRKVANPGYSFRDSLLTMETMEVLETRSPAAETRNLVEKTRTTINLRSPFCVAYRIFLLLNRVNVARLIPSRRLKKTCDEACVGFETS